MKNIKCNNCGKTNVFGMRKSGDWYWARCRRCGFHTSSYLSEINARLACALGEHYISENGNRFPSDIREVKIHENMHK